ncbi:phage capsid protein [Campylobacter iguaniorum]|uniref:phage major capsid protein n=1 Tax=Campylobacter iguaniorum TaxID=1244531 RepID=UPI00073A256C|nr:phage major capsid protein [Campylobacter iguaniorum]ALV25033.1 phage capsid protein [Campylobacter iguaniorum]
MKNEKLSFREFRVNEINKENKSIELSFSSTAPYERYFGYEILSHDAKSVNLDRLNNSAPLLFNHDVDDVIGVVENARIEEGRGKASVRFGNSKKALEVWEDVKDGILKNVSVGYMVDSMELRDKREIDTYEVTAWTPYEISIVSIPADNSVGVGRSDLLTNLQRNQSKEEKMEEKINQNDLVKEERSRVKEINAIAKAHGFDELASKAVDEGSSVNEFRALVLDEISKRQKPINQMKSMELGMNKKEVRAYDLSKVLRALANPQDRKAQDDAGYEFELSRAAEKQSGITAQGVLVPFDVFKRDLTATSTNGVTIDNRLGNLIEILRNKSAVMGLAEILPGLVGNISFPKQTGSMSVAKLTEVQSTTDSDLTLGEITMSPSRYGGSGAYSKQLLHQSSVAIENLIRNDLLTQIGLKIDLEAVTKILNETGIGLVSVATNGGALSNSHIVDLETEIAVSNADFGKLAYLMNARTKGFLKKTPIASGNPKMILEGMDLNGYNYVVSNQIPANLSKGTGSNLSALIFGNFSDLIIGLWGGIDLIVDPYTLSKTGKIQIVADQFADIAIRRAESFAVIKDAKVTA